MILDTYNFYPVERDRLGVDPLHQRAWGLSGKESKDVVVGLVQFEDPKE